ncbi:hypothetical protein J3F84DRAFT_43187 [Trichoderma pleuroticola]
MDNKLPRMTQAIHIKKQVGSLVNPLQPVLRRRIHVSNLPMHYSCTSVIPPSQLSKEFRYFDSGADPAAGSKETKASRHTGLGNVQGWMASMLLYSSQRPRFYVQAKQRKIRDGEKRCCLSMSYERMDNEIFKIQGRESSAFFCCRIIFLHSRIQGLLAYREARESPVSYIPLFDRRMCRCPLPARRLFWQVQFFLYNIMPPRSMRNNPAE